MATTNLLQQVITWQQSGLAVLQNANALVANCNTKFENFQNITTNLGSTVSMDLQYRFAATDGLIAKDQGITQRTHTLTVDQAAIVSVPMTSPEKIFNLDKDAYIDKIGKGVCGSLGAKIESNIGLSILGKVPVMVPDPNTQGGYIPSGAYHTESGPTRFYGDGVTAIGSYEQLNQMYQNMVAVGAVPGNFKCFLPNTYVPNIVGTGLNQFVPKRNDENAMSWDIGAWGTPEIHYYQSNLLPVHYAGAVGDAALVDDTLLTVVSTNDPTGQNVTQITCTCAASLSGNANAIKMGDLGYFIDIDGQPLIRTMTFQGNFETNQPVQFRVLADASATGTTVVLTIGCVNGASQNALLGIVTAPGANQNMNIPIAAGMKIKIMPSHQSALLVSDQALMLAMPRLPEQLPFPTSSEYDPDTGVSLRLSVGATLGANVNRLIYDCIWGSTIVPEQSLRILLPIKKLTF